VAVCEEIVTRYCGTKAKLVQRWLERLTEGTHYGCHWLPWSLQVGAYYCGRASPDLSLNQCHDDLRVVINLNVPYIHYFSVRVAPQTMPAWNRSAVRKSLSSPALKNSWHQSQTRVVASKSEVPVKWGSKASLFAVCVSLWDNNDCFSYSSMNMHYAVHLPIFSLVHPH